MNYWACLLVSGLKFIFHWVSHLLVFSKSLLRLFAEVWILCAADSKGTPSAYLKIFALDERHSVKSKTIKDKACNLEVL